MRRKTFKLSFAFVLIPMSIFGAENDPGMDTAYVDYLKIYDEALWVYLENSNASIVDVDSVETIRSELRIARTLELPHAMYPLQPKWFLHSLIIKVEQSADDSTGIRDTQHVPLAVASVAQTYGLSLDSISISHSIWQYLRDGTEVLEPMTLFHFTVPDSLNERVIADEISEVPGIVEALPHPIWWAGGLWDIELQRKGSATEYYFHLHYCMTEKVGGVVIEVKDGQATLVKRVQAYSMPERFWNKVKYLSNRVKFIWYGWFGIRDGK